MDLAVMMKESGYNYELLKKKVKCSIGVVSKFITGDVVQFDIALKIIKLIAPEKEKEFMFDYCLKSDMPKYLKPALEYAAINQELELFGQVLDKCRRHKSREIQEYVIAYSKLYDRLLRKKNSIEIFNEMNSIVFSSNELSVLKKIIEMNFHYQNHNFKYVERFADIVLNEIKSLKESFMKNSYMIRFNQMMAFTLLHVKNMPEKAREICNESIGFAQSSRVNGFFYNIIATSYFGVSLAEMNRYATKAIDGYRHSEDVSMGMAKRYKKLNMIMSGNLTLEFERDASDPLDLYIEGVVGNDIYKLLQCLVELNKEGSKFFTSMVVDKLLDMNCDKNLIESIQTFNQFD